MMNYKSEPKKMSSAMPMTMAKKVAYKHTAVVSTVKSGNITYQKTSGTKPYSVPNKGK